MRRVALAVLPLLVIGAAPAAAGASTTLGQTFSPTSGCGSATLVQQSEGASVPSYAVPAGGGVITSWSTQADSNTGQSAKFKVFRPTAVPNQYTVIAATGMDPLTPSTVNTFATRIPVQQGDRIGLFGGNDCLAPSSGSDVQFDNTDVPPGSPHTYPMSYAGVMDLSAKLEPDADGDGFGDETQDACPTDPTTQAACQADLSVTKSASKTAARVGDSVNYTIAVKNNSLYNASKSVIVDDALPSNASFVSASGASCGPGVTGHVTCPVGDIAKGATATVTIVVKITGGGTANDVASVSSATSDPNSANNSASASTLVPAPPAVNLPNQRVRVGSNRRTSIVFGCGATSFQGCAGTLVIKTAGKVAPARKKKVLTVGSATYSILPGKTVKVPVRLSKKAFKLLKGKGKLKTIATSKTHDGLGNTTTKSAKVTLRSQRS